MPETSEVSEPRGQNICIYIYIYICTSRRPCAFHAHPHPPRGAGRRVLRSAPNSPNSRTPRTEYLYRLVAPPPGIPCTYICAGRRVTGRRVTRSFPNSPSSRTPRSEYLHRLVRTCAHTRTSPPPSALWSTFPPAEGREASEPSETPEAHV